MWAVTHALVLASGCWGKAPPLAESRETIHVLGVRVEDAAFGRWSTDETPRSPVLRIDLDAGAEHLERFVWMLKGVAEEDVITDLLDPPQRASTNERVIACEVKGLGQTLTVTPDEPLLPGAQVSLVFAREGSDAFAQVLSVSTSPLAGASLVSTLPSAGARAVPPNTSLMHLQFDGVLDETQAHALLRSERGNEVPIEITKEAAATPEPDRLLVQLKQPLERSTHYTLELDNLRDATTAALVPIKIAFETGILGDDDPPALTELPCALDETPLEEGVCLLAADHAVVLRFAASEPVTSVLSSDEHKMGVLCSAETCSARLSGLFSESAQSLTLALTDLAGQTTSHSFIAFTTPTLPMLRIDEVRLDPKGSEPAQEYVELLNFGDSPVPLLGYSLSDDIFEAGRVITNSLTIEPGERVLAVAPAFDASDETDGRLPPGVRLARLSGPLSLSNAGASLVLRDATGHRLEETPKLRSAPGRCAARRLPESNGKSSATFDLASCSPGEETTWQ